MTDRNTIETLAEALKSWANASAADDHENRALAAAILDAVKLERDAGSPIADRLRELVEERDRLRAELDAVRMKPQPSGAIAECPVCTDPNCASTPVTSREIIDDLRLRLRASEAARVESERRERNGE